MTADGGSSSSMLPSQQNALDEGPPAFSGVSSFSLVSSSGTLWAFRDLTNSTSLGSGKQKKWLLLLRKLISLGKKTIFLQFDLINCYKVIHYCCKILLLKIYLFINKTAATSFSVFFINLHKSIWGRFKKQKIYILTNNNLLH